MRIITWNCNMAFRKKAVHLLKYQPDILIIPECEHPDKCSFSSDSPKPRDVLWHGGNKNKGLGIFSYGDFRLKMLDVYTEHLRTIVPICVKQGRKQFILFAIWAYNPDDPDGQYVEQIWKALEYYKSILSRNKVILAGDFNSNTIWDKPQRKGNHSHAVDLLQSKGISSTYHTFHNQLQGQEIHATLYMYRHRNKAYHIDYCFASSYFSKRIASVEIGDYEGWSGLSDHMPLIVTFNDEEI